MAGDKDDDVAESEFEALDGTPASEENETPVASLDDEVPEDVKEDGSDALDEDGELSINDLVEEVDDDDEELVLGDDDDEGEEDGDDDLDDDDEITSPKIQARIQRERRINEETREKANAAITNARNDFLTRNETAHRQRINYVKTFGNTVVEAADSVVAMQREALIAAKEAGDIAKEEEIRQDIAKWEKVKEATTPHITKADEDAARLDKWKAGFDPNAAIDLFKEEDGASDQAGSGNDNVPELTEKWLEKNQWFFDPEHEEVAMYARGLESKLIKGKVYDQEDPKLYTAIAKGVAKQFPKVEVFDPNGKRVAGTSTRKRSAPRKPTGDVSPSGDRGQTATKSGNGSAAGKPSKQEAATMRRFGMDPKNATHVKEWRVNHTPAKESRPARRRQVV